jgi:hypothetical protein
MNRLRNRMDRDRDDSGMTLVELMVTSTVLIILLGMVFISITMVDGLSGSVTSQYQEFQQALPAMAPFHSLVAAEVEPAPPVAGVPSPGFSSVGNPTGYYAIGNFSTVFYANIGTAYDNTVSCPTGSCPGGGSTAGPAKIVAIELDANGNPATACSPGAPCTFQVRMYLPLTGLTSPGVSSCPGVGTGPTCQYSSTYKLVANVQNVVNDPSGASPGTQNNPIFSYTILDTGGTFNGTTYPPQAITLNQTEVQSQLITGLAGMGYPVDTQSLTACAAPSANYPTLATACPADAVQSVTVDLQVEKPGTGTSAAQEDNLVVYRYAQSPGSATAPYQYSATEG